MQPATHVARRASLSFSVLFAVLSICHSAFASTVGFDNFPLGPSGIYNGSDQAGGFTLGTASFNNSFTDFGGGCCWQGWSVSNHGDTTTPGFANQYSSITGGGFGGSSQFGVLFSDTADITLSGPTTIAGAYLTNTTFAALSMLNGDAFAKQFGGASGSDPDWFNVTIEGFSAGLATSSVVFYLADYRFSDPGNDYVIGEWTWVDLGGLGLVDELRFRFDSSDIGTFGINTPSYAALDSLVLVPEPNSALLCVWGLLILAKLSKPTRANSRALGSSSV